MSEDQEVGFIHCPNCKKVIAFMLEEGETKCGHCWKGTVKISKDKGGG